MILDIIRRRTLLSMEDDYYSILGLSKTATESDLKTAYRKLSQKYHPDRNSDSDAPEKFKEVSNAYSVLSDAEKRKVYDKYGKKGLEMLKSQHQPQHNPVSVISHKCTLSDLWGVDKITVKLPSGVDCSKCTSSRAKCRFCGGTGQMIVNIPGLGLASTGEKCSKCDGDWTKQACDCVLGQVPRDEEVALRPEEIIGRSIVMAGRGINGRDLVIKLDYPRVKGLRVVDSPSGLIFVLNVLISLAQALSLHSEVMVPGIPVSKFVVKYSKIVSPHNLYMVPCGPQGATMGLLFHISYPDVTKEELFSSIVSDVDSTLPTIVLDDNKKIDISHEEPSQDEQPQNCNMQ